jgi:hypothetical protein
MASDLLFVPHSLQNLHGYWSMVKETTEQFLSTTSQTSFENNNMTPILHLLQNITEGGFVFL